MNTKKAQARLAAATSIAQELDIDLEDAQQWCDSWERFAKRYGVAVGPYYWDSARGWIDAQRSVVQIDRWSQHERAG